MNKLKKNKEFQHIYSKGKKFFGKYTLIFFTKNGLNINQYGFVASKKVGNAVCRNKARRFFKEYINQHKAILKTGYNIIFVSKKNFGDVFKTIKYEEMEQDIDKIIKTSNLYKKNNK